ncbi:MAG: hypothetical protein H7320_04990 [Ferruginibacter sp.]|nr:hypothetical protein [Ferruginibacter sp.]
MKKIVDKIYSSIALMLCVVCCKQCTSDYIKGGDSKAIANYEKMIFDSSTTSADLSSIYKEVTLKILGLPSKSYEFHYKFSVGNSAYEGQTSFPALPTINTIEIYYLKTDPNFNCVYPKSNLAEEKAKNSTKKNLYWGIGWGILGLLTLLNLLKSFHKKGTT